MRFTHEEQETIVAGRAEEMVDLIYAQQEDDLLPLGYRPTTPSAVEEALGKVGTPLAIEDPLPLDVAAALMSHGYILEEPDAID